MAKEWIDTMTLESPHQQMTEEQYLEATTPPARFQSAIRDDLPDAICLKASCGFPMMVDMKAYLASCESMRTWKLRHRTRVPLSFYRLTMLCRNGHQEVWHADPPELKVAEQRVQLIELLCENPPCGRTFLGTKQARFCAHCKSKKKQV
jgi:hypothetical protein